MLGFFTGIELVHFFDIQFAQMTAGTRNFTNSG